MKKSPKVQPQPEFVVRSADGFQRANGGVVYRGRLWFGDIPVATFSNDGNGGCCDWRVCPNAEALLDQFMAHAKALHPSNPEAHDWEVGLLWDKAMLARAV